MICSTAQAELCAAFIIDQLHDGQDVFCPRALAEAVTEYERASANIDAGISDLVHPAVVEEVREQIERWHLVDPDACVGLLGPGLGIGQ